MNPSSQQLLPFEQPLAKVPHEQLRKGFRNIQRNFERDFGILANACTQLDASAGYTAEDISNAQASIAIDTMIDTIRAFQNRVTEVNSATNRPMLRDLRTRCKHLTVLEDAEGASLAPSREWKDTRMNRWIVDHMLRSNNTLSAKQLASAEGIEALVDIGIFEEIQRINSSLRSQVCTEALAWCSENKIPLRKAKSTLELELRLQEFIELVRSNRHLDAITYSKRYLSQWHSSHPDELQQAMTLLAYRFHPPKASSYRRLYDPQRWDALATLFTNTAYSLISLPSSSLLSLALYAGISALKHPICTTPFDQLDYSLGRTVGKTHDCPVCDEAGLGDLALVVPSSQHLNSSLVCAISGELMDDTNPPLAFNNGFVYSTKALEEMERQEGGVTCPRSHQRLQMSELRKVYVT
ncbi:hypothetical protein DL93DRAFT_2125502 [Clavulina sp. PMI_390]|nr:hypothetical protein DL93DRAFT_2125502 [Clavulina sp. PMI_390]